MGWFKNMVMKLLKITPAQDRKITIIEPLSFQGNVLKNQIWYRGDPSEIEQFFKQAAYDEVSKARFWASVPQTRVRKIHSGIVQIVIDRLKDIVVADLDSIDFGEKKKGDEDTKTPIKDLWDEIAKDNDFEDILGQAIQGALSSGDGAFKISVDEVSKYPVIEFYEADSVDFNTKRGRIQEILFYTTYTKGNKDYRLQETYGKGYVKYKLFSEDGKEVPLNTLEETANLIDVTFAGDFIMGVPLKIFSSTKWKGRGKALFDSKTDDIDALDEVISQWLDAVRSGRVKRYIPEDLIPRNPNTGELMESNPFDNQFIKVGSSMAEDDKSKIDVSQPDIAFEAYVSSYAGWLDLVLQGIISPATLGIDLKKTDNAESQREKEKVTLYTRGQIINALNKTIPELVGIAMMVYDTMQGKAPGEYEASVKFGEYAAPGFDTTVEVVGKAKTYGIMSTEKCVDELYGDTMTDKEKDDEVARIKAENSFSTTEPLINQDDNNSDGDMDE
ncbi:capsid protein [Anaerocolumna sp. MB42-C2]|uniref:capsid protein n=1 Tax=Anaerocolumna sp. MB42-C2 TaxID=3070997 RepID=UPI0027DF35C4|nr:capsid protein [Anaerocolumna sp. MB42-C2]WMJ85485.1 capsid protein [Anaerocolumna sp. MB42-C2]